VKNVDKEGFGPESSEHSGALEDRAGGDAAGRRRRLLAFLGRLRVGSSGRRNTIVFVLSDRRPAGCNSWPAVHSHGCRSAMAPRAPRIGLDGRWPDQRMWKLKVPTSKPAKPPTAGTGLWVLGTPWPL
jgi:hypothetical protein